MVVKVEKENLFILNENATVEEMYSNKNMEFAVDKVVQFVVDKKGRLMGVINGFDKKSKHLRDYICKSVMSIVQKPNRDEYAIADEILQGDEYIVPVVDDQGILLYAYQRTNHNIEVFLNHISNRFEWSNVIEFARSQELLFGGGKRILICSNLGKCEKSVEIEDIKTYENSDVLLCIGYNEDYLAWDVVKKCMEYSVSYRAMIPMKHVRLSVWSDIDGHAKDAFAEITQRNGKYFDGFDFELIFQILNTTKELAGDYVEIGTYRGDSAEAALEYMKQSGINRRSWFFDTYEGFTYESSYNSTDDLWMGSHTDTSIELVRQRLQRYVGFQCVKCNIIEEDLPDEITEIAVCNIDVDMYEAIEAALNKVKDKIVRGGIILAEDYGHTPNLIGGQFAIVEFANKHKDEFIPIYGKGSQLLLIKR